VTSHPAFVSTVALAMQLVTSGSTGVHAAAADQATGRTQASSNVPSQVGVGELVSVRRLYHALERRRDAMTEGEFVGAWTDLSMVLAAVTGGTVPPTLTFADVRQAGLDDSTVRVRATAGVARRDADADRLLALGYSARETADVVSRRISQQALDTAQRMIAVGVERRAAADYLDGQYRRISVARYAAQLHERMPGGRPASALDTLIDRYSAIHQVERALVRAIIATESNFNPAARSPAGAIGLMQLMPGTARELGVNPLVPEQNIEGGIRYFAQLLKIFGRIELALVAYNAGPGFAERYARGQTSLYGETRQYVARVLERLRKPPQGPGAGGRETR
jgi:soluble lytic murein transglycosylase-like protein